MLTLLFLAVVPFVLVRAADLTFSSSRVPTNWPRTLFYGIAALCALIALILVLIPLHH